MKKGGMTLAFIHVDGVCGPSGSQEWAVEFLQKLKAISNFDEELIIGNDDSGQRFNNFTRNRERKHALNLPKSLINLNNMNPNFFACYYKPSVVFPGNTAVLKMESHQWLIPGAVKLFEGDTKKEATWEDELTIRGQFPKLSLEDKTILQEAGIDRDQTIIGPLEPLAHEMKKGPRKLMVYSRRKKRGVERE